MLAPRSILKHADSEEESSLLTAEQRLTLGGGAERRAGVVAARLTGNAALTGSGTLKHPRRTEGCRTDVWEDREGVGGGSFTSLTQFDRFIPAPAGVWPYMVRSRGLLWKAPSGMEVMSLL